MKNKHVDAIVVGAGAGGGIAAKQLACAGLKTVLFERGGWADFDKDPYDELINQSARWNRIKKIHGPDVERYKYVAQEIAAVVGSGTVTYGAMGWRFMREDFRMKSTYGEIPGSSMEDWPISYEDLEPFYEQAEREIGVSGDMATNPFSPPRKNGYPMPAFEYSPEDMPILEAGKRLGCHPFPIPMLRNSVRYNGRAACIRNRTCCGYVCPCDAKNGSFNTVIPVALKSGNCELRTNCVVAEIMMKGKKAVGVRYFDGNNNLCEQTADIVVVAATATQTARLLFNSKNSDYPNGIGNHSDTLGRNLQSHSYKTVYGLFEKDIKEFVGPGSTLAFSDFNHIPEKKIFAGVVCTAFHPWPIAIANIRPPDYPMWGAEHKKFQREDYRKIKPVHVCGQQIPTREGRVVINHALKDFWGIPTYKVEGHLHPSEYRSLKYATDKMAGILREAGAVRTWGDVPPEQPKDPPRAGAGQHQAGTCRMGSDPAKSVVDPHCKVWGTDNLFVSDGSVHVTNAGFNPVLTIMALAFRTGAHIVETFGKA